MSSYDAPFLLVSLGSAVGNTIRVLGSCPRLFQQQTRLSIVPAELVAFLPSQGLQPQFLVKLSQFRNLFSKTYSSENRARKSDLLAAESLGNAQRPTADDLPAPSPSRPPPPFIFPFPGTEDQKTKSSSPLEGPTMCPRKRYDIAQQWKRFPHTYGACMCHKYGHRWHAAAFSADMQV